jgi:hypothetical protein
MSRSNTTNRAGGILRVILNHEYEHIVGALAGCDLRNKTVIFT